MIQVGPKMTAVDIVCRVCNDKTKLYIDVHKTVSETIYFGVHWDKLELRQIFKTRK